VKLKGIGEKTAEMMQRSAFSVLNNKVEVLTKPLIPNPPRKIYLDFEDDPTQDLIYLCGLWIEPPIRGLNYHGLFCMDEFGEAKIWKELQGLFEALVSEDYVVFHYSAYEKTKLDTLESKYGVRDKGALENFRNRMIDLLPIVKKSVVLPARGYGLKKIAPFVGLKYSSKNAGGAQSIVWFHQYQEAPKNTNVMQTLLQYNQEDCIAMKYVESWLRSL
jgi:predicted RecB family nuclease